MTFQNSFKDCFAVDSCASSPSCLTSDAQEKPKYPTEFVQVKDPLVVTGKIGSSSPNYRYWQLDEIGHEVLDLTLEPGQMLGFGAAQIGYRMETDSLKVDRLASTSESAAGAYFVRFGLSKPEFVFFTTQCTEANQNYTAKLDVSKYNSREYDISMCYLCSRTLMLLLNHLQTQQFAKHPLMAWL